MSNREKISEIPVSRNDSRKAPTVSQHNVPAWTIFAMFFVVFSLGSGIVRDKRNGSFIRLKTLPTSYVVAIFRGRLPTWRPMLQAAVIFAIGAWVFPLVGLPACIFPVIGAGYSLSRFYADGVR